MNKAEQSKEEIEYLLSRLNKDNHKTIKTKINNLLDKINSQTQSTTANELQDYFIENYVGVEYYSLDEIRYKINSAIETFLAIDEDGFEGLDKEESNELIKNLKTNYSLVMKDLKEARKILDKDIKLIETDVNNFTSGLEKICSKTKNGKQKVNNK